MRRKFWIAGAIAAVAAALSVAGAAFAVNTYVVDIASGGPGNPKGSTAKPLAAFLNFGYEVGDSENLRPSVIKRYFIAAEGIKYFPKARPTCKFSQADESPSFASKCKKAIVGHGTIANAFGPAADRTAKAPCDVKLTLINISDGPGVTKKRGGMAIRIDTGPPDCPLDIHGALAAPIFDVKIQGVPTSELRFTVPDSLVHPAPGVDNSVIDVTSKVLRVKGKVKVHGKKRTVGFASAVGRKGKKRTVRVTFVDETGRKFTAFTTFPK
jgi:hypothetical protein